MQNYVILEQLHTIESASEILKCNPRVLREKAKSGQLKANKKLGKWYVLYSDLIAFITDESTDENTDDGTD